MFENPGQNQIVLNLVWLGPEEKLIASAYDALRRKHKRFAPFYDVVGTDGWTVRFGRMSLDRTLCDRAVAIDVRTLVAPDSSVRTDPISEGGWAGAILAFWDADASIIRLATKHLSQLEDLVSSARITKGNSVVTALMSPDGGDSDNVDIVVDGDGVDAFFVACNAIVDAFEAEPERLAYQPTFP